MDRFTALDFAYLGCGLHGEGVVHCPHGEETGEVLLLVPHHHAVAHEVPQLGLDLLLDGVGGDVLTPAGDDHILDPTWGESWWNQGFTN